MTLLLEHACVRDRVSEDVVQPHFVLSVRQPALLLPKRRLRKTRFKVILLFNALEGLCCQVHHLPWNKLAAVAKIKESRLKLRCMRQQHAR